MRNYFSVINEVDGSLYPGCTLRAYPYTQNTLTSDDILYTAVDVGDGTYYFDVKRTIRVKISVQKPSQSEEFPENLNGVWLFGDSLVGEVPKRNLTLYMRPIRDWNIKPSYGMYYYSSPMIFYYKGTYERVYFSWMSRYKLVNGSNSTFNSNYIQYYDFGTGEVSPPYAWGPKRTDTTDDHSVGPIFVTDDGYILTANDELEDGIENGVGSGGHNGGIRIRRSVYPEDPTRFNIVGDSRRNGSLVMASYPHFVRMSNGNILCIFRELKSVGGIPYTISYIKTTDNGQNWGDAIEILHTTDSGENYWAYNTSAYYQKGKEIALVVQVQAHDVHKRYFRLVVVRTSDGVNWRNEQGSFTKDVVTNGPITASELNNNCVVYEVSQSDLNAGWYEFWAAYLVGSDNKFYGIRYHIFRDLVNSDPNVNEWYLTYYDSGSSAWHHEKVNPPNGMYTEDTMYVRGLIESLYTRHLNSAGTGYVEERWLDLIVEVQSQDNENYGKWTHFERWRTKDLGVTWEFVETIFGEENKDYGLEYSDLHNFGSYTQFIKEYRDAPVFVVGTNTYLEPYSSSDKLEDLVYKIMPWDQFRSK